MLIAGYEEIVHIVPRGVKYKILPFIDYDEKDTITILFLKEQKLNLGIRRNYLDDIYGIIDGVENGLRQAIKSKHLVENNKNLQIIKYNKKIRNPIHLSYYDKVYYPSLHVMLIEKLASGFSVYL